MLKINKINKINKGIVTLNEKVGENIFKFSFESPKLNIKPGQYISILCDNLILRRPFSVSGFENNIITCFIKLKGEGTRFISKLNVGEKIDFTGPFGNGFNIENNKKSLLIGAGIGAAPMIYLKSLLSNSILACGFKSEGEVFCKSDYLKIGGSICDELDNLISKYNPEKIYACGPKIVLEIISKKAEKLQIDCEIAFEKVMACSIGVCRGCIINVKNDKNNMEVINKTVCKDGPVFKGNEIVW